MLEFVIFDLNHEFWFISHMFLIAKPIVNL